jgi:membrane-bound serine protease (ClpP class)
MNTLKRIIMMMRLAMRARREKASAGASRIIGLTGTVETAIAPEGTIFVRNELWLARSDVNVAAGETVRVVGVNGLTLSVDPEDPE